MDQSAGRLESLVRIEDVILSLNYVGQAVTLDIGRSSRLQS